MFEIIKPKKRTSMYMNRELEYKTSSGCFPVKNAARNALSEYSEYYYMNITGAYIHHRIIPFESILKAFMDESTIPVKYNNHRYEFEQKDAIEFAKYHDDVLKKYDAHCALVDRKTHMEIHSELRKGNKDLHDIEEWYNKLKLEYPYKKYNVTTLGFG